MDELNKKRRELQNIMFFLGSLSSGLEGFIGKPAKGISYLTGKEFGIKCSENIKKTDDVLEAIEISKNILREKHFLWDIEPWKNKGDPDYIMTDSDGNKVIKLVFRDCIIRQTLFLYGHPQEASLCYVMYGFFSGLTESVLGLKSELKILHTGPNACLKELIIKGSK